MRDDGIAVADRLAVVDDVGKLPARRCRCIENMLVLEPHAVKSQERENLETIAVVVGNTEQLGIGIEGDHRISPREEEHSGKAPLSVAMKESSFGMADRLIKDRGVSYAQASQDLNVHTHRSCAIG